MGEVEKDRKKEKTEKGKIKATANYIRVMHNFRNATLYRYMSASSFFPDREEKMPIIIFLEASRNLQ